MQLQELGKDWPALSPLLDEVLALSPSDRRAWLDELPDGARKEALRRLLDARDAVETGGFLFTVPALGGQANAGHDELRGGELVGPWRLLRPLGAGGMGTVWLAERADGSMQREVALKLPRISWSSGMAERLQRERDILARLEHPRISRLYDAGVDASGRPWLAIEYVQGQPIDTYCRELGLDTRARLRLLIDVAGAVAYAHARQVLHRDLKPSNMLVTADGQVKLLDFGIAKLMRDDLAAETAMTRALGRVLTLDYASPEQVRGEALTVASDIYSLGVVAYELLSGSRPYRLERGSAAEVEEAVLAAVPGAASARASDGAAARALRGDLDAILAQALRKEPARRYASVDALAADFNRHLRGERVHARRETIAYRAARAWRLHRLEVSLALGVAAALGVGFGFGATALVVAALAAGLAATLWQARRALAQARQARRHAARADAVQQFLVDLLGHAGIGAGDAEQRRSLTVGQLLEDAAERLRLRPASDPDVQEGLLDAVARLLHGLGEHAKAAPLRRELARRLRGRGASAAELAREHGALGDLLALTEDIEGADAAYREALALLEGSGAARGEEHMRLQARLATLLLRQGRTEEAAALIDAGSVTAARIDTTTPDRGDMLEALSELRMRQGRTEEAVQLQEQAVAADAASGDPLDPRALERRIRHAHMLSSWQRFTDAEKALRAALALVEAAGGPEHPAVVRLLQELGTQLATLGRIPQASAALGRAALAVARRPDRFPPLEASRLQWRQAELLLDDGRIEEAGPVLATCLDDLCAAPDPEQATAAMVLRARHLNEIGRFDDALSWLDRALAIRLPVFGAEHRYTVSVRNRMTVVLIGAGRFHEALARIDEELQRVPTDDAPATYGSPQDMLLANRTMCLVELQRFAEAVGRAQQMLDRFLSLPAGERGTLAESALRNRVVRCLVTLGRLDEAWPQLEAWDRALAGLQPDAPFRIPMHAAWAHALIQRGRLDEAASRMSEVDRLLAAQPSLGPQYRRYPDVVRRMLVDSQAVAHDP